MGDLSRRQLQILLYGKSAEAGRGFIDEAAQQVAWFRYRDALLEKCGSLRPAAYLQFELCAADPAWITTATELFARGLFRESTIQAMEGSCEAMRGNQPAELHMELETVEGILKLELPFQTLEVLVRELGFAEAWHRYRRRPELTAKYQMIGRALRQVLRERVQVVQKKEILECKK